MSRAPAGIKTTADAPNIQVKNLVAPGNATRRWQILVATGVAVLVTGVVIGLTNRIRARGELESTVSAQVRSANTGLDKARQFARQGDTARARAFGLFDAHDWTGGEVAWDEVEGLGTKEADEYRTASDRLETALRLDSDREGLRMMFADVTFERLRRAESNHDRVLAQMLAARLRAYDDDGHRQSALHASARVELEVVPSDTLVWSERANAPRQLLGIAPLAPLTLPPGSLVLSFESPGRPATPLPVLLSPGETLRQKIILPVDRSTSPGMIYVPSGRFLFGSADGNELRRGFLKTAPIHEVQTEAYYVGRYEVTFGEWIEFLDEIPTEERRRRTPRSISPQSSLILSEIGPKRWRLALTPTTRTYTAETDQLLRYEHRTKRAEQDWTKFPVSAVSYEDAVAYATWLDRTGRVPGARLCDEYEWERAARGADTRTYPGGDTLDSDDANIDETYGRDPLAFGPDEVGSHPASRSAIGADDMAGNVWEWTRSIEPVNTSVQRGGGWYFAAINARCVNREYSEPTLRSVHLGVRVCATPR
jgi:formylglycine-generating enzyme required for sulfatase activity